MDDPKRDGEGGGGPVVVHRAWHDAEAELLRNLLIAHGIPATLSSDLPHSLYPITVDGLGEVRILVPATRAVEARNLVEDYLATPTADETGEPEDDTPPE